MAYYLNGCIDDVGFFVSYGNEKIDVFLVIFIFF